MAPARHPGTTPVIRISEFSEVLQWHQKSSGFRFSGITVPKGSTINSATFKPYMANHTNDYLYCKIYGHAVDNSEDFSSTPYISDTGYRSRTTANSSFGLDDQGDGYKSYTVTSIVQEIVNRSGWVNGYALTLLMIGNTSSTSKEAQFYSVMWISRRAAGYRLHAAAAEPNPGPLPLAQRRRVRAERQRCCRSVNFYSGQQWKQHKFDAERCHRDQPLSFGGGFLRLKTRAIIL